MPICFRRAVLLGLVFGAQVAVAQVPLHHWTFESTADLRGGADVTLENEATIVGGSLILDGSNDFASVPIGGTIAGLDSVTVVAYFTWANPSATWARVFDFGTNSSTSWMYFTGRSYAAGARFGIATAGNTDGEFITLSPSVPGSTLTCVAVSIDGPANTGRLYINGFLEGSNTSMGHSPSDLGTTTANWFGRSQFGTDPYFAGSIHEVLIFGEVLSGSQILDICSRGPVMWTDGFESGDLSGWAPTTL